MFDNLPKEQKEHLLKNERHICDEAKYKEQLSLSVAEFRKLLSRCEQGEPHPDAPVLWNADIARLLCERYNLTIHTLTGQIRSVAQGGDTRLGTGKNHIWMLTVLGWSLPVWGGASPMQSIAHCKETRCVSTLVLSASAPVLEKKVCPLASGTKECIKETETVSMSSGMMMTTTTTTTATTTATTTTTTTTTTATEATMAAAGFAAFDQSRPATTCARKRGAECKQQSQEILHFTFTDGKRHRDDSIEDFLLCPMVFGRLELKDTQGRPIIKGKMLAKIFLLFTETNWKGFTWGWNDHFTSLEAKDIQQL
eukprot:g2097.t1